MANTSISAILTACRAKVATVPIARDALKYWLPHNTNQPFSNAPISRTEGFEAVARELKMTTAFGRSGTEQSEFIMALRLGHAPFGTDATRENNVWDDVETLADVLENHAWPVGTEAVFYEGCEVDKTNPDWWQTEMRFRVFYTATIAT